MRDLFLLDPEVTYLNHGSFGACPRPVFEAYQRRQRELEREPVEFIIRRLPDLLAESRAALGAYVGASPADLTFVPNAGTGVNMAARAVGLAAGDEVLATDLEYGALNFTWEWVCGRAEASYVRAPWSELFDHVTERTRVLYLSHITSETALELPVAELVARGRALGLVTIVDGAHAPGHVPLDISAIGADFYAGNCHKWLCAPKGAAFLWVAPEWQDRVDGTIVSWGYSDDRGTFLDRTQLQGTRDSSAYLTVPDAIAFVREHDDAARCVALARDARRRLCELLEREPIAPEPMVRRMASFRVPGDAFALQRALWDEHRIEIPAMRDDLMRISVAMYTEEEDVERLLDALPAALRTSRSPA
ncbi:MAG TPA: aminotransferase class V-fold PLP-dependent enzyme [Gaiellaceae bacterium]|jgi:isopenicillin-N epimerase